MTVTPGLIEMPLGEWPAADRAAWERTATRINGPFRKNNGGPTRSAYTYRSRLKSYGRWLQFLRAVNALDEVASPSSRVTPERLDAYIENMRASGNRPVTMIGRIYGLTAALGQLEPERDHSWVARPQGIPITRYFDVQPRERQVHHSAILLTWAECLFAEGLAHHKPRCRRALIRDAAIIGMLVMPAPRLGALAQLRLGRNLQRRAEDWCLDQDAGITKMSRAEWSPLHGVVTAILDRYLAVERIELLEGRTTDHLWIAQGGGNLTSAGITTRLRKLSGLSFEKVFRAHSFRHCLATTVAIDGHESPLDASILLGHANSTTTLRYYNLAKSSAAAGRHAERMERMLRQAEVASRAAG